MALSDPNVDETMAEDWKVIQEKYAAEEETPEPDETQEAAPDAQDSTPSADAARNKDGTFAKSAKESADGSSKPAKKEPGKTGAVGKEPTGTNDGDGAAAQPPLDQGVQRADVNRAPSSWKASERALWDKVDPALRAAIHRRESEMAAGAQQLLPDAQFGRSIRSVVDPYRMLIEAEGGTPERAVADLLKTAAIFRVGPNEQKAQAIAGIVRQFNVDLSSLLPRQNGQAPQTAQTFRDPRVDQLIAQQNRERAESAQREHATLESTVSQWMNEVDAQGQPTRPYLQDVINEMAAIVPQIRQAQPNLTNAQALEEAYTRAIWANPEIRALLQQQAAAASSAQRQADNQTRLRDVRRAASVNVPRRASVPSAGKPGRMEDTIAETARELGLIST